MKIKRIHSDAETKALNIRLRKIQGQIEGVRKMMEASASCSDVLMQVVAVRRALKSFGEKIIESHLHECFESFPTGLERRRNLRSFLTVLERYVA